MAKINKKKKGFTLVELLIVVIVIGVLCSIMFPAYYKTVLRSNFSTLPHIAKSVYNAQERFFLSNGKYADSIDMLDLSLNLQDAIITIGNNKRHIYVKATKPELNNNYVMYQSESKYFPGEIHCEAKTGDSIANWLCKVALNGKEVSGANADRSLTEGYTDYVINGAENGFFPKNFENIHGSKGHLIDILNGDTCTMCSYVNLTPDTICYGNTAYMCSRSNFSDSTCYAEGNLSCRNSTFSNNSLCVGNYGGDGSCTESTFINSTCEGNVDTSCINNNFTNSTCTAYGGACINSTYDDSVCYSKGAYGCSGSTFKGSSSCYGDSEAGCSWNKWGGRYNQSVFEENSSCYGNTDSACKGVVFKDNSICYANEDGACGGSIESYGGTHETTYEGNACCKGKHCPGNAPKCDCAIDSSTGQHALSC